MNVQRVVLVGAVPPGPGPSLSFAGADDFEIVGRAGDDANALAIARELLPDLVLLDLDRSGAAVALIRRLARELPYVTIVLLTAHEGDAALFEALKAGAHGYVVRNDVLGRGSRAGASPSGTLLVERVRALAWRDASLSAPLAIRLLEEFAGPAASAPAPPGVALTLREREVLSLVARGDAGMVIAARLKCSESAVRNHLRNVVFKLHQRGRGEALPLVPDHGRAAATAGAAVARTGRPWPRPSRLLFALWPRRAG